MAVDTFASTIWRSPGPFSTEQFVARYAAKARMIGSGAYGEAWLMPDGQVMKISASPAELVCVMALLQLPGAGRSVHLPRVTDFGVVPDEYTFTAVPTQRQDLEPGGGDAGLQPAFWYLREELADPLTRLPLSTLGLVQLARDAVRDIWDRHRMLALDPHLANFGVRSDGTLVLRDLACSTSDWWFHTRDGSGLVQWEPQAMPDDRHAEADRLIRDWFDREQADALIM